MIVYRWKLEHRALLTPSTRGSLGMHESHFPVAFHIPQTNGTSPVHTVSVHFPPSQRQWAMFYYAACTNIFLCWDVIARIQKASTKTTTSKQNTDSIQSMGNRKPPYQIGGHGVIFLSTNYGLQTAAPVRPGLSSRAVACN